MVLSACGAQGTPAAATPQIIEKTVMVEGTPQTVVVTATPEAAQPVEFKSKDPTTFVMLEWGGGPDTLDPAYDYETAGSEVIQNVFDTLVFYKREKVNELVPMLATELPTVDNGGISADGKTYTFKIRQGVKFHDGADMTPSDVAFTMQRGLLQGGTSSPQWLMFEPLMGSLGGNNDITDLLDPDGSKGLADNREGLQQEDPAALKEVCEKVKAAVVADDAAGTVVFNLAQSWGPFLVTLAGSWAAVVDQEWIAANGGWDGNCDTWQNFYGVTSEELNKGKLGTAPNGTGPYMLETWTPSQEIVLKANENYWATEPIWEGGPSGAPVLKTVIIKQIDETSTRFAAMKAGDGDFISHGSPADWPQLDTLTGVSCENDGTCTATETAEQPLQKFVNLVSAARTDAFFAFDVDTSGGNNFIGSGKLDGNGIPSNFFSDAHVRKAFAYCFDWETYIADVLQGQAKQAPNVMKPGEPGYDENTPMYTYDPAKCEEEFKASTWTSADGKSLWDTGFRMTLAFNTGNTARQTIAQIFQTNISAVNPNFVIEVTGLPWAAFLAAQRAKKLPFFVVGWQEDIPDPHNWLFPYAGKGGSYSGRQNLPPEMLDQFAAIIDAGVHEPDPAKRTAIYQEFNQLYYDNVPTILLANGFLQYYMQRWVKGYYFNPLYGFLYYYALSKE